ncbi:MAG: antitoxin [Chloroflexi bacterium]|nr:antitoxin [Chloroflexota bacterium]
MIPRHRILQERIKAELADARRAANKAQDAYREALRDARHESFYLDSVALNLHGFYNGIERIFEDVARELDGGLPSGPAWHRDLLKQMTLTVPGVRPAVIRLQTAKNLDEYLRFRHLVRNLYTWNFEGMKLAALIDSLPETIQSLEKDLDQFGHFLESASRADEIDGVD